MRKSNYQMFGLAVALLAVGALAGAVYEMGALHQAADAGGMSMAMAVVVKYGTGARDPASLKAIEGINAAAEIRKIKSLIAVASGDSIASKYMIGELPADAMLDPFSSVAFTAITGASDCDLGIAYPNGGSMILADCIINGHTFAAAGSTTLAAATGSGVATPPNMAKRVWELAGLASNPGGNLALWLTFNAAATAAGTIFSDIAYGKGA